MLALFVTASMMLAAGGDLPEMTPLPVQVSEGAHPRVVLTAEEAEHVRRRAEEMPWTREAAARVLSQADALVAEALEIPHEGGQWAHYYSCDKDGGALRTESPTRHVCTRCGEVYTGWPYDQVYIRNQHKHWLDGLETLGIAYTLTGEDRYAARARDILLEYAAFYRDLPHNDRWKKEHKSGGKLFAQTLNEGVNLCSIAFGYDLVHDAPVFTADDHQQIEDGLLRPMVATIKQNPMGISNWQSWHNAGVAMAGFVLGDEELVDSALNDPKHGFVMQMNEAVLDGGMWHEASPSYHFYALKAHVYLLEGATRAGMAPYEHATVRAMFEGPVRQLLPDRTFPPINDSDRVAIRRYTSLLEPGYRRYGTPLLGRLLEDRNVDWALVWGADAAPEAGEGVPAPTTSELLEGDGWALLRGPEDFCALFDFSKGHTGHVHPAKLNLLLYYAGDIRFVDAGRVAYANPIQGGWCEQTVAHNTVLVDGKSQQRAPAKLVSYEETAEGTVVSAETSEVYEGVHLTRTLAKAGPVLFDVFECSSEEEHTYDLPLHVRGELLTELHEETGGGFSLPQARGYDYLKDPVALPADQKELIFSFGEKRLAVLPADDSSKMIVTSPGLEGSEAIPALLRRIDGNDERFVAAYVLLPDAQQRAALEVLDNGVLQVTVEGAGETSVYRFDPERKNEGQSRIFTKPLTSTHAPMQK